MKKLNLDKIRLASYILLAHTIKKEELEVIFPDWDGIEVLVDCLVHHKLLRKSKDGVTEPTFRKKFNSDLIYLIEELYLDHYDKYVMKSYKSRIKVLERSLLSGNLSVTEYENTVRSINYLKSKVLDKDDMMIV